MAEGNGEIIEEMATTNKNDGNGEPERTADYPKLVEYGLDKRVNILFIIIFHLVSISYCWLEFLNFIVICIAIFIHELKNKWKDS